MESKFHRTFRTSAITGILGLILLALYKMANVNFFYAHYYLIFISFLSATLSRNRYALVNEIGFTIFIGPLFRKSPLLLKWAEVESIQIASSNISWMGTFGARVQVPAKVAISVPALKISLVEPLSKEIQDQVKVYLNKCLYPPTEAINDAGDEIYLKEPPSGGFKRLLKIVTDIREAKGN